MSVSKDSKDVQRSFYVEREVWDACGNLPKPRAEIIREALRNALGYYEDDLPQLRWELEELIYHKGETEAKIYSISCRIEELEEKEKQREAGCKNKKEASVTSAINETMRLLRQNYRHISPLNYKYLEGISGVPAEEIRAFLEAHEYNPSQTQVMTFFAR